MKSDRHEPSMTEERELADGFRAVRDAYDGEREESEATLHRALFQTRVHVRRARLTHWVVLPAAAVLVASTVWAGVTGRLSSHARLDELHELHERPAVAVASHPVQSPTPSSVTPDEPAITTPPPPPLPPPPLGETPTPVLAPRSAPAPSASAPDPQASLFAEAHRLHFIERDPARALVAWDRYLDAAPNGRFAPEARYNRALALVRLGRRAEAQRELASFADGTYGDYRRSDAKSLLDALTLDASRP